MSAIIALHGSTLHEETEDSGQSETSPENDVFISPQAQADAELQPLVLHPEHMSRDYGTDASPSTPKPKLKLRFNLFRKRDKHSPTKYLIPVNIMTHDAALHGLSTRTKRKTSKDNDTDAVKDGEADYLKSKLWYYIYPPLNQDIKLYDVLGGWDSF